VIDIDASEGRRRRMAESRRTEHDFRITRNHLSLARLGPFLILAPKKYDLSRCATSIYQASLCISHSTHGHTRRRWA
jgi:hypothetical protein